MSRPSLLFVCLGNICRSPLAEAAFRAAAKEAELDAHCDSAGTADYHVGAPPDPRSIRTAARNGIDIRHYRGRQVAHADFFGFTHIFAMDHDNLCNLAAIRPTGATAELALLLDAVPGREGAAVADPYYGGEEHFADTWDDVSCAAQALVAKLAPR